MKRILFFLIVLTLPAAAVAGERYFTRSGKIHFISETRIIDLEAENNQVAFILDIETGEIVCNLLQKSFIFEEALAQDHYNENYVESDEYPKAKFKGRILDIENINRKSDKPQKIRVKGKLTMHGVTNEIEVPAVIRISKGKIYGSAEFKINIFDYNIKIPSIVKDRVNNIIPVSVEVELEKYGK